MSKFKQSLDVTRHIPKFLEGLIDDKGRPVEHINLYKRRIENTEEEDSTGTGGHVNDDGSREQAILNYATSAAKTQQQRRMKPATSNGHDDDSKPAIVNLDDFTDAE